MWKYSQHPFIRNTRPLIMAHRGVSALIPENTLPAFEDAYNAGVDCIETDVHLTKDGHFVFFHDNMLDRTTNGTGKVSDYTLEELKKLDAGYRFSQEKNGEKTFPFRGKGLKIHAIEEIIPLFPNVRFNIDIKDKIKKAPVLLAQKLQELNATERVMVGSFHQAQVNAFRKVAPEIATSAGPREVFSFWRKAKKFAKRNFEKSTDFSAEMISFKQRQLTYFKNELPYFALQIPEVYYIVRLITPKFIAFAHHVGIAIQVWTINDRKTMQRLLHWQVDGIFTDNPVVLLEEVKKFNYRNA